MKFTRILGPAVLAAVLLMAVSASTASATQLTWKNPGGELEVYTGVVTAEAENPISFTSAVFVKIECKKSHFEANIEKDGSTITASGKILTFSFNECAGGEVTNAKTVPGSIEIHTQEANVNGNGTLTSNGTKLFIDTTVGECIFETINTDIGILTGSKNTGRTATLDINAAIPQVGPNPFCPNAVNLVGNYLVTNPDYLDVD